MTSHRWKQIEAIFAGFFGTRRTPLSGGNSGITRSDSLHDELFMEVKQRKNPAVMNLFEETAKMAKVENKIPVLGIHKKGCRVWLVVCSITDLKFIAAQQVKGFTDEEKSGLGTVGEGCEEE